MEWSAGLTLLRSFEDHEYWPEYGTFLLRDATPRGPARVRVGDLLGEYAVDAAPCGSVARAGDGWLDGPATDQYHAVRLEVHDSPPEPDPADWAEMLETPMATGGTIGLAMVTGGCGRDQFRLGEPGIYRVRFSRRPAVEGDSYRLQFWPVDGPPDPPRWIARSHPLAEDSNARDDRRRYGRGASDLVSLLLWAQEGAAEVTVDWLADRLLTSPTTVDEVLRHAVEVGLLEPFTSPADPGQPVRLTVRPRRPAPQQPAWRAGSGPRALAAPAAVVGSATTVATAGASGGGVGRLLGGVRTGVGQAPPQADLPPRAGIVTQGGDLVVWRDGMPVVLSRWPGVQVRQAVQSRHGVVLLASTQIALVHPDGEFRLLGTNMGWKAAIDPTGNRLAAVETHLGRRCWSRLHLIELATGARQTMPWDENEAHLSVIAVHAGAVYFRNGQGASVRWLPGDDPQPMPYNLLQVDPYTGVMLGADGEPGLLLIHPDGVARRVAVKPGAALAPGATHLYTWRYAPPALSLFDVTAPEPPRLVDLPGGSRIGGPAPGGPVWEDPQHLLVPAEQFSNDLDVPLVRVDVRTGVVTVVPLPEKSIYRPILVEPCPDLVDTAPR